MDYFTFKHNFATTLHFTRSETEVYYYLQKMNALVASPVAEQMT